MNRFAEPTSVRIGIGIVCESQNLQIGIGIVFVRWELFAIFSRISEIFSKHWPSGFFFAVKPPLRRRRRCRRGGIKKMLKTFLAAVILSASVERCFDSRMRDFSLLYHLKNFFFLTLIYFQSIGPLGRCFL